MKRMFKWMAVVLAVLLLGFGTVLFLWPRDRITVESYKLIRIGMTINEVENVLGSFGISNDDILDWKSIDKEHDGVLLMEPFGAWMKNATYWMGPRGRMVIHFEEGHVGGKCFEGWRSANPSFLDRLRDWLGL